MEAAPEHAALQLLELELVLAADEGVVEDEHVVQVHVRVRPGEVGRAREEAPVCPGWWPCRPRSRAG